MAETNTGAIYGVKALKYNGQALGLITVRETSDLKLESEEATAEEKQPVPSFWERTRTKVLCCFVLLLLFWGLRRFKDKSRNN